MSDFQPCALSLEIIGKSIASQQTLASVFLLPLLTFKGLEALDCVSDLGY